MAELINTRATVTLTPAAEPAAADIITPPHAPLFMPRQVLVASAGTWRRLVAHWLTGRAHGRHRPG